MGRRTPSRAPRSQRLPLQKKELIFRLRTTGILQFLGFQLVRAQPRRVVLACRITRRHLQVNRVVHGGITATLADTAGGLATYMSVPPGIRVATVEMKINFLEGIELGRITADARVIRLGRHFSVVDCDVEDHRGRLVGKALMTFAIGVGEAQSMDELSRTRAGNT